LSHVALADMTIHDEPEIAIDMRNVFSRSPWQESAAWAGLSAHTQRAALGTLDQLGFAVALSFLMRRRDGTVLGIECPFDSVFGETVTKHGAAMVEDDAIGLTFGWAQTASDHLPEKSHFLRGSGQDDAADRAAVEAFGEHHAVGDDLGLTRRQAPKDCLAVALRGRTVDVRHGHRP